MNFKEAEKTLKELQQQLIETVENQIYSETIDIEELKELMVEAFNLGYGID